MDNPTNNPETPYFEVGAVSKITKLSPNTLRTWERRKFIEANSRSTTGRRRYSQEQVDILVFLKKLTNLGDAISSIAHLPLSELRSRLLEYQTQNIEAASTRSSMVKVLCVGNQAKTWASILPTQFKTISNIEQNPNIILIDLDAPQVECKRRVTLAAYEHPDTPIALIYDYAPREMIQQFADEGKFLIHIPCSPELLVHYVHAAMANATHQNAPTKETTEGFPSPPRLFSDKQLATLASSNPNIKCECPHHISALVASLASFENYCRRCEAESSKDAEVHIYLGKEISRARSIVEDALLYLCEKDNLAVPAD